jgi:CRP-like cAMP-binding protein
LDFPTGSFFYSAHQLVTLPGFFLHLLNEGLFNLFSDGERAQKVLVTASQSHHPSHLIPNPSPEREGNCSRSRPGTLGSSVPLSFRRGARGEVIKKFSCDIQAMELNQSFRNHLEKFITFSDEDFREIMKSFGRKSVKKNENLILPGAIVSHTFWVEKGLLVSIYNDEAGKEHIIQFAIENCWITDQEAFYNQAIGSFMITAYEDSSLLTLSFDDREKLCARFPLMERFFRKKGNDSFVKQQRRLLTYLTSNAQERFELLLQEYPGLIQRVPKSVLASYLGVSRETLSRFKPLW